MLMRDIINREPKPESSTRKIVLDTPVSLLNIICTQNDLTPNFTLIASEGLFLFLF